MDCLLGRRLHRLVGLGGVLLALVVAAVGPAVAQEQAKSGTGIQIIKPWTRATPAGAKVAGGFVTITNTGSAPDRLIGGSLVSAGKVEVHEMAMADGVMKMHALDSGLVIAPGQTVELKPGGLHMMFIGLTNPVHDGDDLAGTLVFEHAGTIAVRYHAVAMGASGMNTMDHMKH